MWLVMKGILIGGVKMSSHKGFPLVSGHVSLDLVNTEVVKRGIRQDLLATEENAADWITLMRKSSRLFSHPFDEQHMLAKGLPALKELRTFLREGFEDVAEGKRLEERWISRLEELNKRAPLSFKIIEGSLVPVPVGAVEDAVVSLIAFDTLQLLAKGELLSLHRCANPDCVLLFMDTTGRRKWCSMNACGNRTKVARHQIRRREN